MLNMHNRLKCPAPGNWSVMHAFLNLSWKNGKLLPQLN